MPDERGVALDLLDVRESIEQMGDQIRWIPTDDMLVDCMTKNMPPDAMLAAPKADKLAPFPLKLVAVKAPVTVAPVLLVSIFFAPLKNNSTAPFAV